MQYNAMRVNKVLTDLMKPLDVIVADFRGIRQSRRKTCNCRRNNSQCGAFWDKSTLRRFDYNGVDPEHEYKEILTRLQSAIK